MGFATKSKTKKLCAKEWSKKHSFLSHFFIFHHKPKRMLKFLRNGFWIVIIQKIRKKCLSHSGKMHFSVSGHMTLGVARWRHKLDYICPVWVLSKFGPIQACMCRVMANWFFPSNGIKRYFNGPLIKAKLFTYRNERSVCFACCHARDTRAWWNVSWKTEWKNLYTLYSLSLRGVMVLSLWRASPERPIRVRALAGDIVLCSCARHLTLTVPLSTQVYEWVPANSMLGLTLWWYISKMLCRVALWTQMVGQRINSEV